MLYIVTRKIFAVIIFQSTSKRKHSFSASFTPIKFKATTSKCVRNWQPKSRLKHELFCSKLPFFFVRSIYNEFRIIFTSTYADLCLPAQRKMLNDSFALILLLTNRFLAILIIAQQSLFSVAERINK